MAAIYKSSEHDWALPYAIDYWAFSPLGVFTDIHKFKLETLKRKNISGYE